jgi:hypothetical protein
MAATIHLVAAQQPILMQQLSFSLLPLSNTLRHAWQQWESDEIIARTWQQLDRRQPQGDLCAAFSLAVASRLSHEKSIQGSFSNQDSLLTFHP